MSIRYVINVNEVRKRIHAYVRFADNDNDVNAKYDHEDLVRVIAKNTGFI